MNITPEHAEDIEQLKRALLTIKKLRSSLDSLKQANREPIAIIGIGCRFPGGANSPEQFWEVLKNGVDTVTEIPADRWEADRFYSPDPNSRGKMQSKYGGFIKDIDKFDAHFFGISPREANAMDPQQRIVLEVVWEALEDAGVVPEDLALSQTGVLIGMGLNDYGRIQAPAQLMDPELLDTYSLSGNALCITANRVSYALNLQGPSMVIDSACSSSLVAVHQACQGLRRKELDLALAGGVNLMLTPETSLSLNKFLAPDGKCKTFDARADGYVRGEGAGMVVLKRLSDAVADGNSIYAVIRGSAINQDGYSSGLTVPNGVAQQKLIRQALAEADVQPHQIGYVEAHGTGTALGDPIEANAIVSALGESRAKDNILSIGSVKTNIGHLEAAAGIAGLIKVALALKHRQIPASLHYETPNPNIPFADMPIRVQTTLLPWQTGDAPVLAGVSSFGFGGTNAHAILESAPERTPESVEYQRPVQILTLSAKTENALHQQVKQYKDRLTGISDSRLAELCYAANTRHSHFAHRIAVVADSAKKVSEQLSAFLASETSSSVFAGQTERNRKPKLAFLYTGQGSQYIGMAQSLYNTQPTFRKTLDQCAQILNPYLDKPLLEILYPIGKSESLLDQTRYAQPALFALEYALTELWRSWGIVPDAVMGHSVGEYVAACAAGVFSLEDGLRLIAERGRLMQALPQEGRMAAIFASAGQVTEMIAPYSQSVSIAAINGPENTVVSGLRTAVEVILAEARAKGWKTQSLSVSHAFHSPLMEPILDAFAQVTNQIQYHKPKLRLVSNLTGQFLTEAETPDADYWIRHIRSSVQFSKSIEALREKNYTHFLEIGPKPTLSALGKRSQSGEGEIWIASLREGKDDWQQMLQGLGALYAQGARIDWAGFDQDYSKAYQHVKLPTYPFEHKRYWFSQETGRKPNGPSMHASQRIHPLVHRQLYSPAIDGVSFETEIQVDSLPFLKDHQIFGQLVFPATAYTEMVFAAASRLFANQPLTIEDMFIDEPLVLSQDQDKAVQLLFSPDKSDPKQATFKVFSEKNKNEWSVTSDWQLHAIGKVRVAEMESSNPPESIHDIQTRCAVELESSSFYHELNRAGMEYGASFQNIKQLWRNLQTPEALGKIQLPAQPLEDLNDYQIHPVLLDACIQVLGGLFESEGDTLDVYLPVAIDRIHRIEQRVGRELWSHAKLRPAKDPRSELLSADIQLFSAAGTLIAEIQGIHIKQTRQESLFHAIHQAQKNLPVSFQDWLYEINWQAQENKVVSKPEKPGYWLLFARRDDFFMRQLIQRLEHQGESCYAVYPGDRFQAVDSNSWEADPANPEDFKELLEEYVRAIGSEQKLHVVYGWGLNNKQHEVTIASIREDQLLGYGSALYITQALAGLNSASHLKTQGSTFAKLWLLTEQTQVVDFNEKFVDPTQAPLWGFARTLILEHPELECTCIDLEADADNSQALVDELFSNSSEDHVALRSVKRYVARLVRSTQQTHPAQSDPFQPQRLEITKRSTIDNLVLRPMQRTAPASNEVEIEVSTTGLNFRDVLNALGMYPGPVIPLGNECAGTIVAIGRDVTTFAVGDAVVAVVDDAFKSYINVPCERVFLKPKNLSFSEVLTIPTTFLTAYYGLHHLAKIKEGDRVLIHAAAGGVGLAAVQLAQQAGADLFCTAGNPDKIAFLKSIGVKHVMSSRTLDFVRQIAQLTDGKGVEIILNSLSGDFIPASLSVLAENGCFLEIGKRDDWNEAKVRELNPSFSYHRYDLATTLENEPALVLSLLQQLLDRAAAGTLHPLPVKEFDFKDVQAAFRYMAQAKQIGKIVVTHPTPPQRVKGIMADATYLITGGLGGLGLKVAEWMATQGAKHLVLMGRNKPSEQAKAVIHQLESEGTNVIVAQADVSIEEDVERVLARIDDAMPRLRGVIHAAGMVEDALLLNQAWKNFETVKTPKIDGSWHLHKLTETRPLDFFVLFSAGATILGSAGQANYAAANAFMDSLAHTRRLSGLPAISINWAPWSEVGMAAGLTDSQARWKKQGMDSLNPQQGVEILGFILQQGCTQIIPLRVKWSEYAAQFNGKRVPSLLSELAKPIALPKAGKEADVRQRLAEAPANQHSSIIQSYLRKHIGRVLEIDTGFSLDPLQPLGELGLDSLMAVELRNALSESIGFALPTTLLFDYPTISSLNSYLHKLLSPADAQTSQRESGKQADKAQRASSIADIASLSEDEATTLLLQELNMTRKEP